MLNKPWVYFIKLFYGDIRFKITQYNIIIMSNIYDLLFFFFNQRDLRFQKIGFWKDQPEYHMV